MWHMLAIFETIGSLMKYSLMLLSQMSALWWQQRGCRSSRDRFSLSPCIRYAYIVWWSKDPLLIRLTKKDSILDNRSWSSFIYISTSMGMSHDYESFFICSTSNLLSIATLSLIIFMYSLSSILHLNFAFLIVHHSWS